MKLALASIIALTALTYPYVSWMTPKLREIKGDVFGITRGLTKAFPGRVINSALSESTIVGVSIGRSLAGGRPVAFTRLSSGRRARFLNENR